jgi:flagellar motor switch protein FliN/FliY
MNPSDDPDALRAGVQFEPMSPQAPGRDGVDYAEKAAADLEAVFDVPVRLSVVLGRTRMPISDLMRLGVGTVVELDRQVGEAVEIFVNDRLVARGEIVLVESRLGVTMTEIIKAA